MANPCRVAQKTCDVQCMDSTTFVDRSAHPKVKALQLVLHVRRAKGESLAMCEVKFVYFVCIFAHCFVDSEFLGFAPWYAMLLAFSVVFWCSKVFLLRP